MPRYCHAAQVINSAEVKSALRENFESAIEDKLFGVPTIVMDGHLFWGEDATAMFEAYLENPEMFATSEMARLQNLPVGKHRRESK